MFRLRLLRSVLVSVSCLSQLLMYTKATHNIQRRNTGAKVEVRISQMQEIFHIQGCPSRVSYGKVISAINVSSRWHYTPYSIPQKTDSCVCIPALQ